MKKQITILLLAAMLASMTACGEMEKNPNGGGHY